MIVGSHLGDIDRAGGGIKSEVCWKRPRFEDIREIEALREKAHKEINDRRNDIELNKQKTSDLESENEEMKKKLDDLKLMKASNSADPLADSMCDMEIKSFYNRFEKNIGVIASLQKQTENYCNEVLKRQEFIIELDGRLSESARLPLSGSRPLFVAPTGNPFYEQLTEATIKDEWLELKHRIPSTKQNRIFIRESYKKMTEIIMTPPHDPLDIPKFTITGTPGLGKSLFLVYLLYELVQRRKRVLFVYDLRTIFFDGSGGVFSLGHGLPPVEDAKFWNRDLWVLFDAKWKAKILLEEYNPTLCSFVISTSPRTNLLNDYNKSSPTPITFFMPLWTEPELEKIASLFPEAAGIWHDRLVKLGGVPRIVLEKLEEETDSYIRKAHGELADLLTIIGCDAEIPDKTQMVHRLIHLNSDPKDDYRKSSTQFASQTVIDILAEEEAEKSWNMTTIKFATFSRNKLYVSIFPKLFEKLAIESLARGGTFDCYVIPAPRAGEKTDNTPRDHGKVNIERSERKLVTGVSDQDEVGVLHYPTPVNYPGIDAWIPGVGLFQIAISDQHKLDPDKIEKYLRITKTDKLYWVVPPSRFGEFKRNPAWTKDQFVLKIDSCYATPSGM